MHALCDIVLVPLYKNYNFRLVSSAVSLALLSECLSDFEFLIYHTATYIYLYIYEPLAICSD